MLIHGLPQEEFVEKITAGFPAEIVWTIERLKGEASPEFELVGIVGHNARVFHVHEKPDEGYINVENTGLGRYRALGLLYMINHVGHAHDRGQSAFHFHAASTVGGSFWAQADADLDYERISAQEMTDLKSHLGKRQVLAKKAIERAQWNAMNERIKLLDEKDPRALCLVAAERTPLRATPQLRAAKSFREAAKHYGEDNVPHGPFLLLGSRWPGVYHAGNEGTLHALFARKRGFAPSEP